MSSEKIDSSKARPAGASRIAVLALAIVGAMLQVGCGSDESSDPAAAAVAVALLTCDDSMKTAFAPDANTTVILVQAYKTGDPLTLPGNPAAPPPPTATIDLCLVKLNVGPGSPGTAGAPSTSAGIGMEIWLPLPANWNNKIQNIGGGGWAGGNHGSATILASRGNAAIAATGYVVGSTDTGHTGGNGAFAMREDRSINTALWTDFSERGLHELALKTKALTAAYYGRPQTLAYWNGCSTGGRQGYKMAQEHPEDYDALLVNAPAFNWTKFITNELYPQIAMLRDLGAALTSAETTVVSAAAAFACNTVPNSGGQRLPYILDPTQCNYNPARDATVICTGGNTVDGIPGTGTAPNCVTATKAATINKIWFGQTVDGTAPDPLVDNGTTTTLGSGNHLWWGLTRGTLLAFLAGANPFTIATDMVALEMENPALATPTFLNATGNGTNEWRSMSFADLALAFDRGVVLQPFFGNINTDNPDLRRARDRGVKIISIHGWNDTLIAPQGSIKYFNDVAGVVGGNAQVNTFNRLFMIPAMGHCAGVGAVAPTGTAGSPPFGTTAAATVPLPGATQFFDALVNWRENGVAPDSIVLNSTPAGVSGLVCAHPRKPTYSGAGSITAAASYTCQ